MNSLSFSIFDTYPELLVAFSQKEDGFMNFSGEPEIDKFIALNRKRFFKRIGIRSESVVSANLVHENSVRVVSLADGGQTIPQTDGLLTTEKNLFLSATVGDCLAIFFYDPEKRIVGMVHAGWRGLAKNILESALNPYVQNLKGDPSRLLVGISPAIGPCHFEVKQDVVDEFKSFPDSLIKKEGKMFLDLKNIVQTQLCSLGVKKEHIEANLECTYCISDKYFSYRRDKPEILKTMIAVIGMMG